jgi:hypothetical protein
MTEDRPAFYALTPGGWRDWWSLLHPPYTAWHLSYVAFGAAVAPHLNVRWLVESLAAFTLALGVAAHALDELRGRPLRTALSDRTLIVAATLSLACALGLGVDGAIRSTGWLWPLMPIGVLLVVSYNLELFGGAVHTDLGFAVAWGAFPAITSYVAQTGTIRPAAVLVAVACVAVSAAQRVLSTPVRKMRRQVVEVTGTMRLRDGSVEPLDGASLRATPERALGLLSIAMPILAIGLVVART